MYFCLFLNETKFFKRDAKMAGTLNLTTTQSEHGEKNVDETQFEKLQPGYLLGEGKNFRLVKELGKGGMGVTWLADELDEDGKKKQAVVCKILSKELINDENAIGNVLEVFDLTKELNHTNICPLLNWFQDPVFKKFLVMRYAEGERLDVWFEKLPGHENGLAPATVLPILENIAEALDAMHLRKIIHRDVKPQNIIFSTQDPKLAKPWLIDFGIAQAVNDSDPDHNKQKSGTPIFMAPEQHYGNSQDARTDQYALAVTAFWLLTGHFPFYADTAEELSANKKFPQLTLATVSESLKPTFLRALAYEPKDRFESCGEFVKALKSQPTQPSSPSQMPTPAVKTGFWQKLRTLFSFGSSTSRSALQSERIDSFAPTRSAAGTRRVWTVNGIKYAFRWCPPGSFVMGSPKMEPNRDDGEIQHKVTLTRGFWMLETPVTQAMWEDIVETYPCHFSGKDLPVEQVSWDDCQEFCKKLSKKLGLTVSLPTEAQWEYACRAGTTGAYAGNLGKMGWYSSNSRRKTHPVGQKKPNAWGLYDMHGNVWEWCQDWYGLYSASPTSDPTGPNSGSYRVNRGGGWGDGAQCCRSAIRFRTSPDSRCNDLGFRPVLASPAPEE